jgi:hypothetical protein
MIHLCDCRDCMEFSYGAPMCEDCAAAGCKPSGESECLAFVPDEEDLEADAAG